jgi:hypothetical protein
MGKTYTRCEDWATLASEPLQRGERVLSTARTKGNFAYNGVM